MFQLKCIIQKISKLYFIYLSLFLQLYFKNLCMETVELSYI